MQPRLADSCARILVCAHGRGGGGAGGGGGASLVLVRALGCNRGCLAPAQALPALFFA